MQNDGMNRMTPGTRAAAVALASVLALAGCGGGGDTGDEEPTGDATATSTATEEETDSDGLTKPGTELELQESAHFEWKPNQKRDGSTVSLSVDRITKGTSRHLRAIEVNTQPADPQLYYVRVTLENTGEGDLGGYSPVALPLYANDGSSVLLRPAELLLEFKPCPLEKLPKQFAEGSSANLCLVYLLDGAALENLSLLPDLQEEPITWDAELATPQKSKKQSPNKKSTQEPTASPTS